MNYLTSLSSSRAIHLYLITPPSLSLVLFLIDLPPNLSVFLATSTMLIAYQYH